HLEHTFARTAVFVFVCQISGPIPAMGECLTKQQLELPNIGPIVIEPPLAIQRRVQRNFPPVSKCVAKLHARAFVKRISLFYAPVLIYIELKPARQPDFDFLGKAVCDVAFGKFWSPELIKLKRAWRPYIDAAVAERALCRPLRLPIR